jgi:hypothetical protein
LVLAVAAIANASKAGVEETALRLAAVEHADYQAMLWSKLENVFPAKAIARQLPFNGKRESWEFDAAMQFRDKTSLFEIVTPYANSVNSAVILDVKDLSKDAPNRIAILTNKDRTPHLPVLGSTARWISADANDETYRRAA